jgi:hypothetical protein
MGAGSTMSYRVGKSKPLTEVTLEDCLRYPIWEWALDEETQPGHDESWQRPVTSTTDVTPEMLDPTITFRISGSELIGTGVYDHDSASLSSISIWDDGEWVDVCELDDVTAPLELTTLATILGCARVRFLLSDAKSDRAVRMADGDPSSSTVGAGGGVRCQRTVLAFVIAGAENGENMCGGADQLLPGLIGLATCPSCGIRTDFEYTSPTFRLRNRKYDFSETYDGARIVSGRFKAFCEQSRYAGLRFVPLPKSRGFFHLLVDRTVPLDAERIGIKKEGFCSTCGNYREVFGLFTHHIRDLSSPLEDGLWASDMLVSSGHWKHSVLYAGPVTRQRMKDAGLKGLHFDRYP